MCHLRTRTRERGSGRAELPWATLWGRLLGVSASMGQGTSNGLGQAGGKGPLGNEHSRRGGWLGKEGIWWL